MRKIHREAVREARKFLHRKAYFPLTITMSGYGGREYYGGVDFYPENLEGGQKNFENGDITYCEAHHNRTLITGFAKRFL